MKLLKDKAGNIWIFHEKEDAKGYHAALQMIYFHEEFPGMHDISHEWETDIGKAFRVLRPMTLLDDQGVYEPSMLLSPGDQVNVIESVYFYGGLEYVYDQSESRVGHRGIVSSIGDDGTIEVHLIWRGKSEDVRRIDPP